IGGTTGHLHIDPALIEAVAADELFMHSAQLGPAARPGHAGLRQRTWPPFHMRGVVDEPSVGDRRSLVDTVRQPKTAIEYRHVSLLFRHILSVHINDAAHALSLGRGRAFSNQILASESMGL